MTETQLDPATFDLDAWLDGVQRPRAIVTLYARHDLMAEIDEIVPELEKLRATADAERREDVSLADVGADTARTEELRARLKELWEQYEASGVDFELTQTPDEVMDEIFEEIIAKFPDPAFDASDSERQRIDRWRNDMNARLLVIRSVTAVGPHGQPRKSTTMTEDTYRKLRARFGVAQVAELVAQARTLTYESRVDAPFSRRVSAILDETLSA